MNIRPSRPMLSAALLLVSLAACSAGSANPAVPGSGASARIGSVQAGGAPSAIASVPLGAAASYAILAGSTITSTGPSRITGDVGLFPGSAVTGFPPAKIDGRLHTAGPIAKRAQMDLMRAYNGLMGRVLDPITVAGNIGGRTLYPGLYKSTSSLAVSSGDLTLDARGNRNARFIFQVASSFTMTTGRKVILTNGARPQNVFWGVGSSATLGTGCSFYGTLLAHKSISVATGSVVTGRMLARLGAVTMQSNTIVKPAK